MKHIALTLFLAASSVAAIAQTPAKPATSTTAHRPAASTSSAMKLPPGVPVVHGIVKTAFSLKYQDYKLGVGPDVEPGKMLKVHYTGWRAADGVKFDSSFDHPGAPVMGPDNKPELGPDGKPKLGPPQPMAFPQGMGRLIPGFDQGFFGMKVGGKRRLFIPWQLAYGNHEMPAHGADHPGIPAKSDLIFDVELVEMTDAPAMPTRPGMGVRPPPHPGAPANPGAPGSAPGASGSAPAPAPSSPGASPAPTSPPPAAVPVTPPPSGSSAPATPPSSGSPQSAPPPSR
jgi:peptidylprolyl isomerase